MAQSAPPGDDPPIGRLRTIVELLDTPKLARMYAHAYRNERVTVSDFVDELGIPQGTAYDYVRKLESAGLLAKRREKRPFEYTAEPISLSLATDGEERTISTELVDAVGRQLEDGDIEAFVDRHGLDGLARALEYAHEYVDGSTNHRIAARELDLSPLEAEIILQALEPVVLDHGESE